MPTNVHLFPTTILLFAAVAVAQNTPPASVDTSPAVDSPRAYLRAAGGLSVLPSTCMGETSLPSTVSMRRFCGTPAWNSM